MANVKISELAEATSLSASDMFEAVVSGANRKVSLETLGEAVVVAPGGSDTQIQWNNAGAFGGVSGGTSDGANITFGAGNLKATSPRITTGIDDANGNELIKFTATASAVNELTIANAATGSGPVISATGGDANINIVLTPKGTGGVFINSLAYSPATPQLRIGAVNQGFFSGGNGIINLSISGADQLSLALTGMNFHKDWRLVWNATGAPGNWNGGDTGLSRNAAGIVEVNNGTVGTFRDLKLRNLESVDGNIVLGTSTGTKIGTATSQKLAFFNATPVVQQTGGAATASIVWTATEQGMLQKAYDALRTFGLLS